MILQAMPAAPATQVYVRSLTCGPSTFRLESEMYPPATSPLAAHRQRLTVTFSGRRRPLRLDDLDRLTIRTYDVRRGMLSSWACVRATTGQQYVMLGYGCAIDTIRQDLCGDEKEWFHWLDRRGRTLDRAIPHAGGPALTRMQRRLGVERLAERGIQMIDAVGE